MNFDRLIAKHAQDIIVTRTVITQDGPRSNKSTEEYIISECAVLKPNPDDIEYYDALQYVNSGIKIYEPKGITAIRQSDNAEIDFTLQMGDSIKYKNVDYEIAEMQDRTTNANVSIYVATKEVVE